MARPKKTGLEYFPTDVNFLKDRKFRKIKLKYGYLGTIVYFSILCLIYQDKGYYLDYSNDKKDDIIWEILEQLQGKFQPTEETIVEIIDDLVACELFSGDQFKLKTITSKRIQSTYYSATVERDAISIDFDKWILSEDEMLELSKRSSILSNFISRAKNSINQPINSVDEPKNPQSKVKESKVNKSKVKESSYSEVVDCYHSICISFPKISKITDKRERAIKALLNKYDIDTIKSIFSKAEKSLFLKGEKGWMANFDWIIKESNFIKILEGIYDDNSSKSALKQNIKIETAPDKQWLDYMEKELERINGQ